MICIIKSIQITGEKHKNIVKNKCINIKAQVFCVFQKLEKTSSYPQETFDQIKIYTFYPQAEKQVKSTHFL